MKSIAIAFVLMSLTVLPVAAQNDDSPPVATPSGAGQGTVAPQGTTIQNDTMPGVAGKHADGKGKDACKARIEAICPGVQPGGGRIMACLKQNNKTLAEICPERAKRMQEKQSGQNSPGTQAPVAQPTAQ